MVKGIRYSDEFKQEEVNQVDLPPIAVPLASRVSYYAACRANCEGGM